MKRTARVIVMILLVASLLSMSTALAAEQASYYISRCSVAATGGDGITITFSILATDDMTDLGATKIVIRNAYDIPVKTFEYTDVGCSHMMGHNDAFYVNNITYEDAVPGARYFAEVYFLAGDSTGSDTAVLISDWAIA